MGSTVEEIAVCEEKGKQQVGVESPLDKGKQLVALTIESTPPSMVAATIESTPPSMVAAIIESPPPLVVAASQPSYVAYPKALAKYNDVVASAELFMKTLEKLHATMGTKFMIPTIGGKELDLHRLFVEVTSRGGIEKVITDRRWREVTATFSFPSTATNASFVLRKYYLSLLSHYEQIYLFESQGWSPDSPPPSGNMQPSPTAATPSHRRVESLSREARVGPAKRRRNNGEPASPGLPLQTYNQVVGVLDGKFDQGYFISVTIGTQNLKGILYPVHEPTIVQPATANNSNVKARLPRRRKKHRDPGHPKPNRSGYNFFFAEQHARLKPLHPGKDREISKMIGDLWNKLTETDKMVYQEKGVKDKERYKSEMAVYKETLKTVPIIAVPIQQRPAEPEDMIVDGVPKVAIDEGGLPSINQNESSSDASDFEGKESEEDSETDTPPEIIGTAADSPSLVAEPSPEEDGFQVRMREDAEMENGHGPPTSSEGSEPKKFADS